MTNKPMLSVERELLERLAVPMLRTPEYLFDHRDALDELRALLDTPSECRCKRYGKDNPHWPCPVHAEPAAQHQGEPVVYTTAGMLEIAKRLPLTGRIGAKATKDERWNIPLFLGQGEQPAPVAITKNCCGSCPGGCVIGLNGVKP